MILPDQVRAFQIRDRPCRLQDPVIAPRAQVHDFISSSNEPVRLSVCPAKLPDLPGRNIRIKQKCLIPVSPSLPFRRFFDLLLGQRYVREMIEEGATAEEIKARWQPDVEAFKELRKPYLLYAE